jgi:hypothetical protein
MAEDQNDPGVPTVAIPYTDRTLGLMLDVRRYVLEQHGLMKEAREVVEQMTVVHDWQMANLDKLTPYPGVISIPVEAKPERTRVDSFGFDRPAWW